MNHIVPNIITLVQAKNISYDNRPEKYVYCSKLNPCKHGTLPRQPDRENSSAESLNPVNIQRYYCKGCKKTFSAIPECISPKRWYTWTVQEKVLMCFILGCSAYSIAKQYKPSYKTIRRWLARAGDQFIFHKHLTGHLTGHPFKLRR